MSELLTPAETAAMLAVSERTLREWRKNKVGPPHLRLSHTKVRYRTEDVDAWIDAIDPGHQADQT